MNFRNNLWYFCPNILLAVWAIPDTSRVPISKIQKKMPSLLINFTFVGTSMT